MPCPIASPTFSSSASACFLQLVQPLCHRMTRAHLSQESKSSQKNHHPQVTETTEVARKLPDTPRWMSDRYSLTVNQVSVRDLLFAISRDSGLDIDLAPGIDGVVTLNAVQQPLPILLQRIARQLPLRFEFQNDACSSLRALSQALSD